MVLIDGDGLLVSLLYRTELMPIDISQTTEFLLTVPRSSSKKNT